MKKLDTLEALDTVMKRTYTNRHSTKLYPLALKLFAFNKILIRSDKMKGERSVRSHKKEPPQMKTYRDWLAKLEGKILKEQMEKSGKKQPRGKKRENFSQPGGSLTSFPISTGIKKRDKKWFLKREPDPCPSCGHNMLMSTNDPDGLFKNLDVRFKEYEWAMAKWEAEGSKPKEQPKEPKGSSECYIVCMCCVSRCVDRRSGSGCIVCEGYAKNSPEKSVPWDYSTAMCQCGPCRCPCGVYFPRSKWMQVELQAIEEKREKEEAKAAKRLKSAEGKKGECNIIVNALATLVSSTHSPFRQS